MEVKIPQILYLCLLTSVEHKMRYSPRCSPAPHVVDGKLVGVGGVEELLLLLGNDALELPCLAAALVEVESALNLLVSFVDRAVFEGDVGHHQECLGDGEVAVRCFAVDDTIDVTGYVPLLVETEVALALTNRGVEIACLCLLVDAECLRNAVSSVLGEQEEDLELVNIGDCWVEPRQDILRSLKVFCGGQQFRLSPDVLSVRVAVDHENELHRLRAC